MNREQRRAAERADRKERKQMWPGGHVIVPKNDQLNDGDMFTVKGLRRLKNGRMVTNCKPGLETVFVARQVA